MALATSNRAQVRYIKESTFGTTPGSGNCTNLRVTGESLDFGITSESSKEIRSDRQVTDLIQTGASASGGLNIELSYKEFDPMLEAALQSAWVHFGTDGVSATVTLEINSTAGTLTASAAPTGTSDWNNLATGQWVKLTAPGDAADGAYLKVGSVDAPGAIITVDAATPIPGTGTRAAVADCTLTSSLLENGTTQTSYSIEVEHADVTQFRLYRGMTLSKLSLAFASAQILTGSMDFMGKDMVLAQATGLPGTPVASQTYDVMNAVSGVGNVLEGGSPLTGTFIKSLSMDIDNALRGQDAIGVLGNAGIASGTLSVTGSADIYFADEVIYDKFIANSSTSITFSAKDGDGNGYVFVFPKVKFSSTKVNAGGLDQDAILSMQYQALMDATLLKTVQIYRL